MTSRLTLAAPATLTVLEGNGTLSTLEDIPPGGVILSGASAGATISLEMISENAGAELSASSFGGATVSSSGATLALTGTTAELNTALASLEILEPLGASNDVLELIANSTAALPAQTGIAVNIVPDIGPAFVAPPATLAVRADALNAIPGLFLSDSLANGLALMGLGKAETLTLTLSVGQGVLVLPDFSEAQNISANGLGSGTIELDFTADQITTLNTLLAGLEFVGATGATSLFFALRNDSGPLPAALTYGTITLRNAGTPGTGDSFSAGSQTLLLGGEALSGTLAITGMLAATGDLTGNGAVDLAPGAVLQMPLNALDLGGTNLDFGSIQAGALALNAPLFTAQGATFNQLVDLGPAGLLEVSGLVIADNAEADDFDEALSLAAGAVVSGSGTLQAGNFTESGLIDGNGMIIANPGDTLLVSGGEIGPGIDLAVATGGVLVLGPLSPLYGVFDTTPLTIASGVVLNFAGGPGEAVTGLYASSLGGAGGAFVISGPQAFSGTFVGFAPGDAIIFPSLGDFTVFNETSNGFEVVGTDASGTEQIFTLDVPLLSGDIAAGEALITGLDAQGDPEVMLRAPADTLVQSTGFAASAGVAEPLPGLSLELTGAATQSLALTLAAAHGTLSLGTLHGTRITLSAQGLAALNNALGSLSYTGTGLADAITFTSATPVLAGFEQSVDISAVAPGTVDAYGGGSVSEADVVDFGAIGGLAPRTAWLTAGAIAVSAEVDFEDPVLANGISGTALEVDNGATAIFGLAATVALLGGIILGDAGGAGTLAIVTPDFMASGNLVLGGAVASGTSALDVLGSLALDGTLQIGLAGAAQADIGGALTAAATTLGTAGTLFAYGTAGVTLGAVQDGGLLELADTAANSTGAFSLTGTAILGSGASLKVNGALSQPGMLQIGVDASLEAANIPLIGLLLDAGTLTATGAVSLNGGTIELAGGTLAAGTLSLTGLVEGEGVLDAPVIINNGLLYVAGAPLYLEGNVTNTGVMVIESGAALDITGSFSSSGPINFGGTAALLTVNEAGGLAANVQNFSGSDAIDLVGVAPGLVSVSASGISIGDGLGNTLGAFGLSLAAGQAPVVILPDGAGGALITLGGELPCFARGTRLLTPAGYRAIETLRPGDRLVTASGVARPLRWLGRRTLDLRERGLAEGMPVLIHPGAFGPGQPARLLRLSASHAVYVAGVLVPVTHLVNGATITREQHAAAVTYYHAELDRHDILLAEGLACESYLDTGNRAGLYEELGRHCPARKPFAEIVTGGARLAAIRHRLHGLALAAGFRAQFLPRLRAISPAGTVLPTVTTRAGRRTASLEFSRPVREILLLSNTACPADTNPDSRDRRELGLCLAATAPAELLEGWLPRAPGDEGTWMGRASRLRLHHPSMRIRLPLAAVVQSWRVDRRRRAE